MNDQNDEEKDLEAFTKDGIIIIDSPTEKIETHSAGVSISATGIDDVEREYYFPGTMDTHNILDASSTDLNIKIDSEKRKKILDVIDIAKTYVSEFSVGFNLEEGVYLKIKREPKKVIKYYEK